MSLVGIMLKFATWLYVLILAVLTLATVLSSWASHGAAVFSIEVIVDSIFIIGIVLFAVGARIRWWLIPSIVMAASQIFLWVADDLTKLEDVMQWLLILAPGYVMNAIVATRQPMVQVSDSVAD